MITGQGIECLPQGNIGYVSFIGIAIIAPASYFAAPVGAKIAHSMDQKKLNLAFGLFLFVVSTQMLYRYL
jgi:uncharacterized membrane protein YfcA